MGDVSNVEFENCAATETTLDMFDRLEENGNGEGI